MPAPIISDKLFAAWGDLLTESRPEDLTEADFMSGLPEVASFAPAVTTASFAARFALKKGGTVVLELNPVAARHLACCIMQMGAQAGWLDETLDLTSQILPPMN